MIYSMRGRSRRMIGRASFIGLIPRRWITIAATQWQLLATLGEACSHVVGLLALEDFLQEPTAPGCRMAKALQTCCVRGEHVSLVSLARPLRIMPIVKAVSRGRKATTKWDRELIFSQTHKRLVLVLLTRGEHEVYLCCHKHAPSQNISFLNTPPPPPPPHTHTHTHTPHAHTHAHTHRHTHTHARTRTHARTHILRVYSCLDLGPETGRLQHV